MTQGRLPWHPFANRRFGRARGWAQARTTRRSSTRRTLRHPLRGDHHYPKPVSDRARRRANRSRPARQPRFRPRRNVNVAALVGSPEEVSHRPSLRLTLVGLIALALLAVMVLRLWSLQVIDYKSYAKAVTTNEIRTVSVPAPRGEIVDRNDTVLAGNQVQEEIVLSRYEAMVDPAIKGQVAALVGLTPKAIQADLDNNQYSPYQPVPVLVGAPIATIEYLKSHQSSYPGVSVEQVTERDYPQGGTVATPVLGYVGAITSTQLKANPGQGYTQTSQYGQAGLEEEYQAALAGKDGTEELAVNAQGQEVDVLKKADPTQGDTVVTNIDLGLEEYVDSALAADVQTDRKTVDATTGDYPQANDAAAVVLNANNGQVLALASYPTYDLNAWIGGISDANYASLSAGCNSTSSTAACPLVDYAIDGLYTPGSTFKLNTATAALDDGVVSADTYVDDTGTFTVPNCTVGCTFHDDEAADAGEIDIQQALTESDDYYFYNLGYLFYTSNDPEGIQKTAAEYGLGQLTGIDLPGEAKGQVDSAQLREDQHKEDPSAFPNSSYYVGDNIEMAFGQGETLVTPIEQAVAYATFANGGTRYQPEVASAIVDPTTGKVVQSFAPKVLGHVSLPPSTYQPMLAGFEGVINDPGGTGYGAFHQYAHFPLSSFPVAGKTGTADVSTGEPNSWFVGFGPTNHAGNEPEYVVAVVVDHGGYGAQAAAPAVANIFNYLYANPVQPVVLPTAQNPPSTTAPSTIPPA